MSSLGDRLIPLSPLTIRDVLTEAVRWTTEHGSLLRLMWAEILKDLLFNLKANTVRMDISFLTF